MNMRSSSSNCKKNQMPLYFSVPNSSDLNKTRKSLKNKNFSNKTGLSNTFLKLSILCCITPLFYILACFLEKMCFSKVLVIPVHKIGDTIEISNFEPK